MSAAVESVEVGVECPETTVEWDGTPTKCRLLAGHAGQHDDGCLTWSTGLSEDSDETEELAKIADLARAYGKAYAAWVTARRDTPNDLVETTMNYVDAERALRAGVCPKALAEEETLP